jgi:lysine decarboxylase
VLRSRPGLSLDPARLVVGLSGVTGQQAAARLEEENVYCEMCDRGHLVFILTCMDGPEALKRLKGALLTVTEDQPEGNAALLPPPPEPPGAVLTLRQAMFAPREWLTLKECAGRVSACQIAPYPPGVPVIAPGESVTKKHLAYLEQIGYNMERKVEMVQG